MAETIITKTCYTCNTEKPVSEYFKDNRTGKPRSNCKHCHVKKKRANERLRGVPSKELVYKARTIKALAKIPSEPTIKLLEQNAREAWNYHVNVMASDEWRAGYFEAKRKIRAEKYRNDWRKKYKQNPGAEIYRAKKAKEKIIIATPPWANQEEIKNIYIEAGRIRASGINVHVDHIIPLKGKIVCGLHVPSNLQIITAKDNYAKRNHYHVA